MSAPYTSIQGLRVLVVEDDALVSEILKKRLTYAGCEVVGAVDNGRSAVEAATSLQPDLILMDVRLKGDMDGPEVADVIRQHLHAPIVYLTGHADQETLQRAKAASAYGYVLKPLRFESLLISIDVAIERFRMERALEDSQLTHAAILRSVSEAVVSTDVAGHIRFMNAGAERLTGWRHSDVQGHSAATILRFADGPVPANHEHLVMRVLAARGPVTLGHDEFVVDRTGKRLPVVGGGAPVIDNLGRLVGATITLRDVTDIRNAEAEARSMSERLRAVIDTAVDGVMLLDAKGKVLLFNPACQRLFGYAAHEVMGRSVEALLPSPLTDDYGRPLHSDRPEGPPVFIVGRATQGRRKDSAVFPAEVSVGEASRAAESRYVIVVHDVSERKQLEAALLDAIGHEQRRLGRELHDGLGQELTGLMLLISSLARAARHEQRSDASDLERTAVIARHAIQTCGSIARGLSPVDQAHGGLIAGLRDLVERLQDLGDPHVEFSATDVAQLGLSAATTDHLYRIAQEAISNALKHAHAHSINVTLDVVPKAVRLEICDDGEGGHFPEANEWGLGLRTMKYRAAMIGARFMISPKNGAGTCVVCECPRAA
jgi:PAS domain S-box-containing protein